MVCSSMALRAISLQWLDHYPDLQSLSDPVWQQVLNSARRSMFKPGESVFRDGEACQNYLLVLAGSIRVQKVSEGGHEIALYHVGPGQTCEVTTSCLLANKHYTAEAVAETEVDAIFISKLHFMEAVTRVTGFRNFIFSSLDKGLADLLSLLEEVAFTPMDQRLAQVLLKKLLAPDNHIKITHHELAAELGTAREVVSRLLKEFERQGWAKLHRGHIQILDINALRHLLRKKPTQ